MLSNKAKPRPALGANCDGAGPLVTIPGRESPIKEGLVCGSDIYLCLRATTIRCIDSNSGNRKSVVENKDGRQWMAANNDGRQWMEGEDGRQL